MSVQWFENTPNSGRTQPHGAPTGSIPAAGNVRHRQDFQRRDVIGGPIQHHGAFGVVYNQNGGANSWSQTPESHSGVSGRIGQPVIPATISLADNPYNWGSDFDADMQQRWAITGKIESASRRRCKELTRFLIMAAIAIGVVWSVYTNVFVSYDGVELFRDRGCTGDRVATKESRCFCEWQYPHNEAPVNDNVFSIRVGPGISATLTKECHVHDDRARGKQNPVVGRYDNSEGLSSRCFDIRIPGASTLEMVRRQKHT